MQKDCIFCQIAAGNIPSVKIWGNDKFVAILDIRPSREGQTVVISKEHYDSDFSNLPQDIACKFTKACQEVAGLLKKGMGVSRVIMVAEGLGVNHAHFKLYPYYKGGEGHLNTALGEQVELSDLQKVADKITGNN